MGIYSRTDSPYWWMHLETAPKGQRKVSTQIRMGFTATERKASRAAAETLYHARSLTASQVHHQLIPVPREAVLFKTFAAWYDTQHIAQHKGREREREILPRLVAAFGHLPLTAVTREVVIEWRTHRRRTPTVIKHFGGPKGPKRKLPPPSARTVNREIDLLQMLLTAAVEVGHLEASPLFGLEDLDVVTPIRRTMSEEEERLIAPHLSAEDYAILLIGLDGLVRLGDILDLRRADDTGRELHVRDPKNGTPLRVPISTRLRAALDKVPVTPDATQAVWYFPGRRHAETERDRRNGYVAALYRACEKANVPYGRKANGITFHWATRRTGATRMIRRGGEKAIGVVQQIGGWKDPSVLIGIYQETITDEMIAAVETVAPAPPQPVALKVVPPVTPRLRKRRHS